MPAGQDFHKLGEVEGLVNGAVVSDHPMNLGDAEGGEERSRPAGETDRGRGLLFLEGFGVGQPRKAVHCQVHLELIS